MRKRLGAVPAVLAAAVTICGVRPARATARKFTYTYQSAAMPAGQKELELWTTWRVGRDDVYSRFDDRAEFEYGVTDRLLGAFYFNWSKESVRDPLTGSWESRSQFGGVSNEWKYKLLDAAADPVGLAGYGELSFDTDEAEVELKIIVDKAVGPLLIAYNAVVEPELGYEKGELEADEVAMEHDLGCSVDVGARWAVGAELREHSDFAEGAMQHAALFAGPMVHFAAGEFWITATAMIQLPALKAPAANLPGHRFVLDGHEKVNTRVLVSLPF